MQGIALQAGAFFGSLFAIPIADRYGRKMCIFAAGVLFNVGVVIQMISHSPGTLPALYVGRVFSGLGIGFISLAVPIYISEISREYTLLSICGPSRAYVIRNTQLLLFVVASLPYVSV